MASVRKLPWPKYDFESPLYGLLLANDIEWVGGQICLNTTPDEPDNYRLGVGSLDYDWSNPIITKNIDGTTSRDVKRRDEPLREDMFTELCSQFKGTAFEDAYNMCQKYYRLGRVRLMKSQPHTCLSWHVDSTDRFHYPITTTEGARMVIESESFHLDQDNWWWTHTTVPHTAFNGTNTSRIHMVGCILEEKINPWNG